MNYDRMNTIDLIIFDMDGTLYEYENGVDDLSKTPMSKEIFKNGAEFIANKFFISTTNAEKLIDDLKIKYNNEIAIGLNIEYGIDIEEFLNAAWYVDPSKYIKYRRNLRKFLLSFKQKKAVLTASPQIWAEKLLHYLDIYDIFDGVWARNNKLRKPDLKLYKIILSYFNVKPEKTMVIEDNNEFLKQPKELGMHTVLISKNSIFDKSKYADFIVRNIIEIDQIHELIKTNKK